MVPPIPQAAWAAPSSPAAGDLLLQSNNTYNLSNGTYNITNGNGTKLTGVSLVVGNGKSVVLNLPAERTITLDDSGNKNLSPISVQSGGSLTIVTAKNSVLNVYGSRGVDSTAITSNTGAFAAEGSGRAAVGTGGYPGIYVPTNATLTLRGDGGQINAYGGDASKSTTSTVGGNFGASGGGGAGAGIGGNGGNGGQGAANSVGATLGDGFNGAAGGNAGTIYILDTIRVTAYGGGAAAGGGYFGSSPGGGGGYPAAGVGGGGAGGGGANHGAGGGGFSGGAGEPQGTVGANGYNGADSGHGNGGSYFQGATVLTSDYVTKGTVGLYPKIGGTGMKYGTGYYAANKAGDGGQGGGGGKVYVGNRASLVAMNGSMITTSRGQWGKSETPIYLQMGYKPTTVQGSNITKINTATWTGMRSQLSGLTKSVEPFTNEGKEITGIGSGAGATESSNGTFTIQKVPERVDTATLYMRNTEYF
ncbi:MAG: hypothetical protein HFI72_03905 [Peptococcaceae bacterium]|jgi:hypothetical protein|nr:hypothetical protein [Peptococcaceae bacterium]